MSRLFLIGYRGSGKTTVARLVAERLAWDWCDADVVLEQRHGQSIKDIFAVEGEEGFRVKEARLLEELSRLDRHVIATGGGIVLRPENRERLRTGKVAWLSAPPVVLWERLQNDATTAGRRPNLGQGGLAEVEELLQVRAPLYADCADVTLDTADRSPKEIAAELARWFSGVSAKRG